MGPAPRFAPKTIVARTIKPKIDVNKANIALLSVQSQLPSVMSKQKKRRLLKKMAHVARAIIIEETNLKRKNKHATGKS